MLNNRYALPLIGVLLLALYPLVGGNYGLDLVAKIMIYAIFALSLELLVGSTGLVCFGHAALFGIGAYAAVLLAPESEPAALWWIIPAAVAATAAYALFMGALSLRTKGVYFIMVTLAFAQMAYFVVHDTPLGGGTDGIYLYIKPVLAVGDTVLIDLDQPGGLLRLHAGQPGGGVRRPGAAAALAFRARAGRHQGQRTAHARHRLFHLPVQARGLRDQRCAGGLRRLPVRGEGRLREPRAAELAPERRGADHDHPRRPGPPARRGAGRVCLRAAAGVLQVRGHLRRLCQALAPGAGADHHLVRGLPAERLDRPAAEESTSERRAAARHRPHPPLGRPGGGGRGVAGPRNVARCTP